MKRKLLYFTLTFIKRFYKSSFTPVIFLVNHISTCANHTFKSVMMLQRQPAVGPAHEILLYNALCRRSVGATNTLILKLLNESIICPVTRCRCTQQKKDFFFFFQFSYKILAERKKEYREKAEDKRKQVNCADADRLINPAVSFILKLLNVNESSGAHTKNSISQ